MITDEILLQVEKPARYIGNEINMIVKNTNDIHIRFAFCFPDVYEIGMSHLGMQILYFFINQREDTYCERAFAPWVDMEKIMREKSFPLFALETSDPLSKFDFLGFTLQFEMSYTNILNMLDLSNLEIFSKDRHEDDPIICGGGPCGYNPEPLADILDFFYMGEGEVVINDILDMYKVHKSQNKSKKDFLKNIMSIEGIYVPMFYDVKYKSNGEIQEFFPLIPEAPKTIKKVLVKDIDNSFYPEKQLIPLIESVHDRATLELFRGCIRGCRFCQAGYVYRPTREKTSKTLLEQSKNILESSGHEEISLMSLSTSDYTEFKNLTDGLIDYCEDKNINISLPSLRIDAFNLDVMERIQKVRRSGLTFAPEAGTQRLRDVINKGLTKKNILDGAELAFSGGYSRVKLYFMIGLPTETNEDILGIANLSEEILDKFFDIPKENRKGGINIVVSTSCFIPKPFTPFQWYGQNTINNFREKQILLKKSITRKQIKYNYHDSDLSFLEGVISRGDRRVSKVIFEAWRLGAKFDSWSEFFKNDIWLEAFKNTNVDPDFYATRHREYDEILPWDFIDIGVSKEFFINEHKKALGEVITENCRELCSNCGAEEFNCGVCYE